MAGLPRRRFLGLLLTAMTPAAALTACGGGGTAAVGLDPHAKPLISFVDHSSEASQGIATPIDTVAEGLSLVPDRFQDGSYCQWFDGPRSRMLMGRWLLPASVEFAVSCWIRCFSASPMRLLSLDGPLGPVIQVDLNRSHAVSVRSNGADSASIATSNNSISSDTTWHHVLVQFRGESIELFFDGVAVGSEGLQTGLRPIASMQVGGDAGLPLIGAVDDLRLHNRAYLPADVPLMVYRWNQVKPTNPADGVAGYYPFNRTAVNETGKGLDGVLHNVDSVVNRFGHREAAFAFNGVDSYIELQDSFDSPSGDFAIGFWVRSTSLRRMTALSISPGQTDISFVFNTGQALRVAVDGQEEGFISTGRTGDLTDGLWHFVFLQRSGDIVALLVDGTERGSTNTRLTPFGRGSVVRIGRNSIQSGSTASFWHGELDDLQIYERSFTPQEVQDLKGQQFRPRDGAGMLTFGGRMWLLGGWNEDNRPATNSEVWSSPDGQNWAFAANAPWEGRHTAGYAVFRDRMWIVGGDRNSGHYQNDVWSSPDGVQWDLVTNNVPWAGRATHYTLAFADRLWTMGGQEVFAGTGSAVAYNDVYSSLDGRSWKLETASAGWSPRGLILGSVVFRDRMWVIGGGTYDVRSYLNDVWSSDDGVHWEQVVEHAPWSGRQYHSVTVFDEKIWVIAGGQPDQPGGANDVWYSDDGRIWTQLAGTPWPARHAASVTVHRNRLWLAAGSRSALYNDVWQLGYAP